MFLSAEPPGEGSSCVRVAAVGDIHCRESRREEAIAAFANLDARADLLLLAGDLTAHGLVPEAEVLADAVRGLRLPVFAVLGNHDWHEGRQAEIRSVLESAGAVVLEGEHATLELDDLEIGVVGAKGYVGGFPGSHLSDYGEDSLRAVYREAGEEVAAMDAGLRATAACDLRLVVLHYSPTEETLVGEPEGIWTFLGSDRLAAPIREHGPDLVVHGHAHAGRFEGRVADVPVYNVSVPVLGRDYHLFEVAAPASRGVH
ncbi:MAG TPA: metallophosphoesterase [Solirubrobacterales bacterium]|nr:metallophosphoesterase [Solirubrobacterales bacterium]